MNHRQDFADDYEGARQRHAPAAKQNAFKMKRDKWDDEDARGGHRFAEGKRASKKSNRSQESSYFPDED